MRLNASFFDPVSPKGGITLFPEEENSVPGEQTELKRLCSEGISEKEQILL